MNTDTETDIALDGPAASAAKFFKANPDEVLARDDVSAKFSLTPGAVEQALRPAVAAGLVSVANSSEHGRVWRAGPRLKFWTPDAPKPQRRGGLRLKLPPLDLKKIKLSKDLAVPRYLSVKGTTRYDGLIDALTADGMSQTGIPRAYGAAISKAVQTYLKNRPELAATSALLIRRIDDETVGLWRVARPKR